MTPPKPDKPKHILWSEFHRRVKRVQATIEERLEKTPEEKARILHERAIKLAAAPNQVDGDQNVVQVVEFSVAYERYAIEAGCVGAVAEVRNLTPLPGAGEYVVGIIYIRGSTIPVVDLGRYFGLPERGITDRNKAIILRESKIEFALLADSVAGSKVIQQNEIYPPPAGLGQRCLEVCRGITRDLLIVLDGKRVLETTSLVGN